MAVIQFRMSQSFPSLKSLALLFSTLCRTVAADSPTLLEATLSPPEYAEDGSLLRPEGFEEWVFVGASLGLSYSPHKAEYGDELFHNVYLDRRAYEHYVRKGEFPEKSMLAMSVYKQASKAEGPAKLQGSFEGEFVSLEVSVKDSERFEEGWAYFDFSGGETQKRTAKPFAREKCHNCHAEHASEENVFVQFYPVLRRLKADAPGASE